MGQQLQISTQTKAKPEEKRIYSSLQRSHGRFQRANLVLSALVDLTSPNSTSFSHEVSTEKFPFVVMHRVKVASKNVVKFCNTHQRILAMLLDLIFKAAREQL